MKRKPEIGCELKKSACGASEIVLKIESFMSAEKTSAKYEAKTSHRAAVALRLVEPWFQTARPVRTDSHLASVETKNAVSKKGLRFIGVVKTAPKKIYISTCQDLKWQKRGLMLRWYQRRMMGLN